MFDGAMLFYYVAHYILDKKKSRKEESHILQSALGEEPAPEVIKNSENYSETVAIANREAQLLETKQLMLNNDTYAQAFKSLNYHTEKQLNLLEFEWANSY